MLLGNNKERVQVFLLIGSKYNSNQAINSKLVREHLETFLSMLRERRRPFALVYFHTQMNTFSSGPLSRIRNVVNAWTPAENSLLVSYDVIHPRWFTKFRDSFRRHPDPDVRFASYRTIVDFLI